MSFIRLRLDIGIEFLEMMSYPHGCTHGCVDVEESDAVVVDVQAAVTAPEGSLVFDDGDVGYLERIALTVAVYQDAVFLIDGDGL